MSVLAHQPKHALVGGGERAFLPSRRRPFRLGNIRKRTNVRLSGQNFEVLQGALLKFGKGSGPPSFFQGLSASRDFIYDTGTLPNPTDTHGQAIQAPDRGGLHSAFAPNVLTRTNRGLQTIPTRANSNPNPNQTGVVAGTPGTAPTSATWSTTGSGLTRTIVAQGIDPTTGLTYTDVRFAGTASATFDIILDPIQAAAGVAASVGQTWTASVFLALIAGTLPGTSQIVDVRGRDAANALTETLGVSFATVGATPTRFQRSLTYVNAATVKSTMAIRINAVANGAVVDFTLRIINPQLELGGFASSPITASQTTNGNQQIWTGLGANLGTGVAGFIDLTNLQDGTATTERFFEFNDGTGSNRLLIGHNATTVRLIVTVGGVAQVTMVDNYIPTQGTRVTLAFCVAAGYSNMQIIGRSALSAGAPAAWPVIDRLAIAGQGYAAAANNYQFTHAVGLRYLTGGDVPATVFAEMVAKATLKAAA